MAYTALDKARANLARAGIKQRLAEIAAEAAADARKIAERKHEEEIAAAEDRYREAIRKATKAALKAELDRITALDKAAKAESEVAALSPAPSIESAQEASNEQREAAAEEISKEDTNTADDQKEIPAASEAAADTLADEPQEKTDDEPQEEPVQDQQEEADDDPDDFEAYERKHAAEENRSADDGNKEKLIEHAEQIVADKVNKDYPDAAPSPEQLIESLGKIRRQTVIQYAMAARREADETKKKEKKLLRDAIVNVCDKTIEEIKNEKEEK